MAHPQKLPRGHAGRRLDFADETLIAQIKKDQGPEQVANVATLRGFRRPAGDCPTSNWGYGFAIGGVAATDPEDRGRDLPGGVGYDINCGGPAPPFEPRMGRTSRRTSPIDRPALSGRPHGRRQTAHYLFEKPKLRRLMEEGSAYVVREGWGTKHDLEFTEANGRIVGADPDRVSDRAYQRGYDQCGTSLGQQFLEVQVVDRVVDDAAAAAMGLREGQITVPDPFGVSGLGYQVCDDHLGMFKDAPKKYGFTLPDFQLACAPVRSPEGPGVYWRDAGGGETTRFCNRYSSRIRPARSSASFFKKPWEVARPGDGLRRRPQHRQV